MPPAQACFSVGTAQESAVKQTVRQPGDTSQLKLAVHLRRIDGVRAIAVLLVVLCHAGGGFPGVLLGVDGFFGISGCLITGVVRPVQRWYFASQRAGFVVVHMLPAFPTPSLVAAA